MNKRWLKENRIWLLLWAASLAVFLLVSGNHFIAYDEAYTLSLIKHSFPEVVRITGLDVHPPLYYLIVKCLAMPFDYTPAAVKAVNLLPLLGMLFLGRSIVRRVWGEQAGLWFTFLTVFIPANQTYLLPEMRMYGFASFFVVCALLAEQLLIREEAEALSRKKAWVIFALSGLAAAYTQYYALIAVALIYLVFAGCIIAEKKKLWKGWISCALLSVIGYLPWLFILLGQFRQVKADYWIPPITVRSVISYIMFPVYSGMSAVAGLVLAVGVGAVLVWGMVWKSFGREKRLLVSFVCVYFGMIAVGVAVSLLVRPLFNVRYVKCVLGILTLAAACVLCHMKKNRQRALACLFILFTLCNVYSVFSRNMENNQVYGEMRAYAESHFSKGIEDTVILHREGEHTMGIFAGLFGEWQQVIPDSFDKEEYEAFAPTVLSETEYEEKFGKLTEKDLWVLDDGNMQNSGEWNGKVWNIAETSPLYYIKDGTDILQFMMTDITEEIYHE